MRPRLAQPTLSQIAERVRREGPEVVDALLGGAPALLISSLDPASPVLADTPALGTSLAEAGTVETAQARSPLLVSLATGSSRVVPLLKSARNPFGALITVGRGPHNDVRLTSGGVSKQHAFFSPGVRAWRVQDAGSRNGTWVEARRLGPREERELEPGSSLRFGDVHCIFLDPSGVLAFSRMVR